MKNKKVTSINILSLSFAFVLLTTNAWAQHGHQDQKEYGYRGKVKTVVKKTYSNPIIAENEALAVDTLSAAIHTYFFNQVGNIDSAVFTTTDASGASYSYKTVFQFKDGRKTSWTALSKNNERLLYGVITWAADKAYKEEVIFDDGSKRATRNALLNDSFRIAKLDIKGFNESGIQLQNDNQEFSFDSLQNIHSFKTTNLDNGSVATTIYKYLESDPSGNPIRLVTTNQASKRSNLIVLQYIYYP